MKKIILIFTGFFLMTGISLAQHEKSHAHMISLNFQQIDEEMNYGLVFKGLGLGYSYHANWQNDKRMIIYEGRFNVNFPMTRDIAAMSYDVVPARFDYLFKLGKEKKLSVGPYFIAEYNYMLYPDLQSGYSFWFTNFSLGGALNYAFDIKKSKLDLVFHTTVMGLTSRQPEYDDPYFFDLGFDHAVKFVHQDMQFGSWNLYNQSELEVRWRPKEDSRLAYAYTIQYYGYFDEPKLTMLNQSVKLMILPKKDK